MSGGKGPGAHIKPLPPETMTPALLDQIEQRVLDGIFLGGNYESAYQAYLRAHRDRKVLLEFVRDLQDQLDSCESIIRQASLDTWGEELTPKEFADRSGYDS
jgi:hypothetical protein